MKSDFVMQLPVDPKIYDAAMVLLKAALGPLLNPIIPVTNAEPVHFERFFTEMMSLFGSHLLLLSKSEIAFILRKCLHAVAARVEGRY